MNHRIIYTIIQANVSINTILRRIHYLPTEGNRDWRRGQYWQRMPKESLWKIHPPAQHISDHD